MDYKQMIGKEVIGFGKDKGKIKGIDKQGRLQIKYEGYTDTYCFDPFIKGCVIFVDENLQKEINKERKAIYDEKMEFVRDYEKKALQKNKKAN